MDLPELESNLNALLRALSELHERKRFSVGASVTSVAFSPSGARVLTGSEDNIERLWDAETGAEIRAFRGHQNWVTSVAFSPDGVREAEPLAQGEHSSVFSIRYAFSSWI
jgi:WD40 repeat protein